MERSYQIIAVDFDGTLCYSQWPELGDPNQPLINYLKQWKSDGNKLILWTCRANEALATAVEWCRQYGLEFDAVNDNLQEVVDFYGNNSRKITCDWYIDDRSLRPERSCFLRLHSLSRFRAAHYSRIHRSRFLGLWSGRIQAHTDD